MINKDIPQYPIIYFGSSSGGRLALGWGAHTTVGNECKAHNIKNALVVTTGLKGTGIIDEIVGILNYHDVATTVFDKITSNPKDHEVMAGYKVYKEAQCDGVVSVGGGSSHDCGKAIRLVNDHDGIDIIEFGKLDQSKKHPVTTPQISVNTTSGTGAQATHTCAITDTKARTKGGGVFRYPGLNPAMALDDPLLIRMQPQHIAAQTGFDAFCHAFELYVSRIPSMLSTAVAYNAIKLVAENLREFTFNRMNDKACENMTWATALSGSVGLGSGSGAAGIVHGLSHGISAVCGTHHGLANAVITIPAERYNQPVCPERFAQMAEAMGVDTSGMTKMQASDAWFEATADLLKDLEIETGNLSKNIGLTKEECEHIVKTSYRGGMGNPRDYNYEETIELFESML